MAKYKLYKKEARRGTGGGGRGFGAEWGTEIKA